MNPVVCSECREIAVEIIHSYQETWVSADPSLWDAWEARSKLIGETEEDVLRAGFHRL